MSIFNAAASNKTQPISRDYASAAQLINLGCGPGYVNATVPQGTGSSGTTSGTGRFSTLPAWALFLMVVVMGLS